MAGKGITTVLGRALLQSALRRLVLALVLLVAVGLARVYEVYTRSVVWTPGVVDGMSQGWSDVWDVFALVVIGMFVVALVLIVAVLFAMLRAFDFSADRAEVERGYGTFGDRFYCANGELQDGCCYLRMFREEKRSEVYEVLGYYPTLERLLCMSASGLVADMDKLQVSGGGGTFHIAEGSECRSLGEGFGGLVWKVESMGLLRFPSGTVGHALCTKPKGDRLWDFQVLSWTVGSAVADWDVAVELMREHKKLVTADVLVKFFSCFTQEVVHSDVAYDMRSLRRGLMGTVLVEPEELVADGPSSVGLDGQDSPVVEEEKCKRNDAGVDKASQGVCWRGVHYDTKTEKNRARRLVNKDRKKRKQAKAGGEEQGVDSPGFFSDCSDILRRELRESRALRFIEENKLATLNAMNKVERVEYERDSGMIERKLELARLAVDKRVDAKLEEGGYAETILTSGTVSPNSSLSVVEEVKLRKQVRDLQGILAEIRAGADPLVPESEYMDVNHDYHNPYG